VVSFRVGVVDRVVEQDPTSGADTRASGDARRDQVARMGEDRAAHDDRRLTALRRGVWVLLALQFVALAIWSTQLWTHYSITNDGGQYLQGFFLISHGHFGAYDTVRGEALLKDHFTLAWWPMSVFDLVWPHGLWFLWLQDAAMVAGEVIAFQWMWRVIAKARNDRPGGLAWPWPMVLVGVGGLLLVANPWTYWAISWDVHLECYACPFILAAAYDLCFGHSRRAWLWVLITLSFGDVTATWVLGLALSAALAARGDRGRHLLRTAGLLAGAGLALLGMASALGGTGGTLDLAYGYLLSHPGRTRQLSAPRLIAELLLHPSRTVSVLWSHIINVLADIGPSGYLGVFTTWTFGVPLVVLLENNLISPGSQLFSWPTFQSTPVFTFASVGTVTVLTWLALRAPALRQHARGLPLRARAPGQSAHELPGAAVPRPAARVISVLVAAGTRLRVTASRVHQVLARTTTSQWIARRVASSGVRNRLTAPRLLAALAAILTVNAVFWAAVWIPAAEGNWLRISGKQAAVLQSLNQRIPVNDEVVVSQGVVGRFADRTTVYDLVQNTNIIPVSGRTIWFVVVPNSGIENQQVDAAMSTIGRLADSLHARLMLHAAGIWAFRWQRPPSKRRLVFADDPASIPGWAAAGPSGVAVLAGPTARWRAASDGHRGYVVAGDYWRRPTGSYEMQVSLSSATTVYAEVWDDNSDSLVGRAAIPPTNGKHRVTLTVPVTVPSPPKSGPSGWGPFRIKPVAPPPGQTLEIRVYSPSGGVASIYRLGLRNVSQGP
jgi:hypothetical protein